jgi:hypothetical protein
MSIMTTALITGFPEELHHLVAKYLTMQDLNKCMRVSHVWQNLFSSNVMWEPIAKKLDIKKKELNSFHQFVNATVVNYIPNFVKATIVYYVPNFVKNQLLNDDKSLVCQKLSSEEQDFQKKYPEFVKVFDGITAIRHLPTIEITPEDLMPEIISDDLNYESYVRMGLKDLCYFKDEHFFAPVVRLTLKRESFSEIFILFRIRDNETGTIYRDAISFFSLGKERYFTIDHVRSGHRIIATIYSNVTQERLDRLQRLIQGKPVGMVTWEGPNGIIEESRTTCSTGIDIGKSILELC